MKTSRIYINRKGQIVKVKLVPVTDDRNKVTVIENVTIVQVNK